jgi:hypothetical protein
MGGGGYPHFNSRMDQMNPESVSPVIDQELSPSQSNTPAAEAASANESLARKEDTPRCSFRYLNRHQCRFPITPHTALLCAKHSSFRPDDPDSIYLAPALLGDVTQLNSAVHMQTTLSKLLILLAQNRISPRKAAVQTCRGRAEPVPPAPSFPGGPGREPGLPSGAPTDLKVGHYTSQEWYSLVACRLHGTRRIEGPGPRVPGS